MKITVKQLKRLIKESILESGYVVRNDAGEPMGVEPEDSYRYEEDDRDDYAPHRFSKRDIGKIKFRLSNYDGKIMHAGDMEDYFNWLEGQVELSHTRHGYPEISIDDAYEGVNLALKGVTDAIEDYLIKAQEVGESTFLEVKKLTSDILEQINGDYDKLGDEWVYDFMELVDDRMPKVVKLVKSSSLTEVKKMIRSEVRKLISKK